MRASLLESNHLPFSLFHLHPPRTLRHCHGLMWHSPYYFINILTTFLCINIKRPVSSLLWHASCRHNSAYSTVHTCGPLASEAALHSVLICIRYPGRVQNCFTFHDSAHHVLISRFWRGKKISGRGLFQVSRIDERMQQTASVWRFYVWRYDLQGLTNQDIPSPSEAPVSP